MSEDALVLVHILARHGQQFSPDPNSTDKYQFYDQQTLTEKGKRNMYNLGTQFRERYIDYLGDTYSPEDIDTWITEYAKTKSSAQAFSAGLFSPSDELYYEWDVDFFWPPININCLPLNKDDLLGTGHKVDKFHMAYYKIYDTEYGKNMLKKHEKTIAYVREHTGLDVLYLRQLLVLYFCFRTEAEHGLPLPEWAKSIYPDTLGAVVTDDLTLQTSTNELKRYLYGRLFKKILTDSQDKINNRSKCKLHLYVGHETNIMYVLMAFGLWDYEYPKSGSSLTFEVHRINNKYGIKLFYKKSFDTDFELMTINNKESIMWLDDFEKSVEDLWSDDTNNLQESISNQ